MAIILGQFSTEVKPRIGEIEKVKSEKLQLYKLFICTYVILYTIITIINVEII